MSEEIAVSDLAGGFAGARSQPFATLAFARRFLFQWKRPGNDHYYPARRWARTLWLNTEPFYEATGSKLFAVILP